jgi:hypothetical protein
MPETRGLVQRIKLDPDFPDGYWVYIGPSPTNTTLFAIGLGDTDPRVMRRTSMITALNGALFARREVIVTHAQNSWVIEGLQIVPG